MSTYKVPLTEIRDIYPHANADKLEFAVVYGFNVVVQKDKFKVGDRVIYVPIDSILPEWLEKKLFPPESKIKLHKSRVKQIKIRGAYSQGMLIDPNELPPAFTSSADLEEDLSPNLGIMKYEPPTPDYQTSSVKKRDKPKENPFFHKYGGLDNFKWYPDLFEEGEEVSITEKIHGSNIRAGYVPFVPNTLFKKILKFLRLAPTHEWCYGSNNVQLQARRGYSGFYGSDVYGKVLEKYGVKDKLKPGEVIYGELYGDGIQKGYNYGCTSGEHKLVIFDLKIQTTDSSHFVDPDTLRSFCEERGFDCVPELHRGPFTKGLAKSLTLGDSVFCPSQKVREGIVIKPVKEMQCYMGRKVLKMISEKYLESDQSDFH